MTDPNLMGITSNSTTDLSQTENDDYLGDFDLEADMACLANE